MHLLSSINTAAEIPIKNIKLIVNISTVIWCPRLHRPSLATRCGPPIPFTTVKWVELAVEIVSRSLVLIWFGSIGMIVVSSLIRCIMPFGRRDDDDVMFALYNRWCCCCSSALKPSVWNWWWVNGIFLWIWASCSKLAAVSSSEPDEALCNFQLTFHLTNPNVYTIYKSHLTCELWLLSVDPCDDCEPLLTPSFVSSPMPAGCLSISRILREFAAGLRFLRSLSGIESLPSLW